MSDDEVKAMDSDQEQEQKDIEKEDISKIAGENAVDITPNKDGGVFKLIKKEGTGDAGPLQGDSVFVHYVGTLTDGEKFDSSRDRNEQFDFTLDTGNVIKAWDVGVATMKRGEVCVLTCRADYAYGARGSPPKIPANATLLFEVELFDWKGEDLSEDKDESILRSVLEKGDGYEKPNEGATVEVHLTGRYNGVQFEERDVSFVVGEGSEHDIVVGVETAILKFRKGEKSLLKLKASKAFGTGNTEKNIPIGADVEYEVKLKQFEKAKESWELDPPEKVEQAEIMKTKGTNKFKAGNLKSAQTYYKKIVEFLDNETEMEEPELQTKRDALMLAAHLNLAMCHLKLKENLDARDECDKALVMDPTNEKALFRRGQAKINIQDYDSAMADFKAVLAVDPNNKAAKNQITIALAKVKEAKEKERKIYGGMFAKFAAQDAKLETSKKPTEENEQKSETESEKTAENGEAEKEEEMTTENGEAVKEEEMTTES